MSEDTGDTARQEQTDVSTPGDGERAPSRNGRVEDRREESGGRTPDVYLDVPVLEVDEIDLEVEDLRAHVSLQAEVLDLVKLNVGVDASLGRVKLGIRGVNAQATLKVRLDEVAGIVGRVLDTIDRNPQILEHVTRGLGQATEEVGAGAGQAVEQLGSGASDAVSEVGSGAATAAGELGRGAGQAVSDVGEGAGAGGVRRRRGRRAGGVRRRRERRAGGVRRRRHGLRGRRGGQRAHRRGRSDTSETGRGRPTRTRGCRRRHGGGELEGEGADEVADELDDEDDEVEDTEDRHRGRADADADADADGSEDEDPEPEPEEAETVASPRRPSEAPAPVRRARSGGRRARPRAGEPPGAGAPSRSRSGSPEPAAGRAAGKGRRNDEALPAGASVARALGERRSGESELAVVPELRRRGGDVLRRGGGRRDRLPRRRPGAVVVGHPAPEPAPCGDPALDLLRRPGRPDRRGRAPGPRGRQAFAAFSFAARFWACLKSRTSARVVGSTTSAMERREPSSP